MKNDQERCEMQTGANALLSANAKEFLAEVNLAVDYWASVPLLADQGTNPTLARLRGLAASLIRLVDSADLRGWDIRDIAYEINQLHDVDVLLSQQNVPSDELER